jgi:hypothetical protein
MQRTGSRFRPASILAAAIVALDVLAFCDEAVAGSR